MYAGSGGRRKTGCRVTAHTRNSGDRRDAIDTETRRQCGLCRRDLPLSAFYIYRDRKRGIVRPFRRCKRCVAERQAERRTRLRAETPSRIRRRNRAGRNGTKRLRAMDADALVAELRARLFVSEWKQHLDTPPEERRPNDEAFVNILVRTATAPVIHPELVGDYIKAIGMGASA